MPDTTDTNTFHDDWARHLTDERLADDLRRYADDVRWNSPSQRAAPSATASGCPLEENS